MQEINTPEELEAIDRLEQLKSHQSRLGRDLTGLENLSDLFRLIQQICKTLGSKIDEHFSKPNAFLLSSEEEKSLWYKDLEHNVSVIKNQIKELQLQKDTILYPDTKEYSTAFW